MSENKYCVAQHGYDIFGVGSTYQEALQDAVEWIEGVQTPGQVQHLINNSSDAAVIGDFHMLYNNERLLK